MCALDRRERPLNSQSVNKYILNVQNIGNDSNLLIVFYVQIMPDDFVMQLHRF
ncbi:Aldehyde dehydrogenase [Escherichia coli]